MPHKSVTKCIGILTAGGDCPGLNAAIRGVVKPALNMYGMKVIGIMDGFRGLVENRTMLLDDKLVSGILTTGGTVLGTSRDKPHKMMMGGEKMDMTAVAVENAKKLQLDCLVCLGGGGTQKNAYKLHQKGGVNVLTLPKTIDNDVCKTDFSFGFHTALDIATEAIDRLHTTATSHHRIIVCELMGHRTGWLALGAGIAGGADVILIPEIPYDLKKVGEHLRERRRAGKRFSIVAIAEGAVSQEDVQQKDAEGKKSKKEKRASEQNTEEAVVTRQDTNGISYHLVQESKASRIARELQQITGSEARVTSLGHVQRGGSPSAKDRMLCTLLGTRAARLLAEGKYNVMVAVQGDSTVAVDLKDVIGDPKFVPEDHPWVKAAYRVGTCLGI